MVVRLGPAAAARPASFVGEGRDRTDVRCAFVNNMPDGAFDATERQFLSLLESGSGSVVIDVRCYTMSGVPRGDVVASKIAERYASFASLRQEPPDLLIVTGSNPVEMQLENEAYWPELVDLLTWGSQHVGSMLLSCLSAHAALKIFDQIERERLPSKCTGVFSQQVEVDHPLTAGMAADIVLPHSRTSVVSEDALRQAGYDIALRSDAVGWSVATRHIASSDVVLVQGHPEYDPSSLLREYQRDARRYVLHERDELPCLPLHCVAAEDWVRLEELHRAITGSQREAALIEAYPFADVGARAPWPWQAVAQTLYANVLVGVVERSNPTNAR